mmetsp:Transcript_9735/g.17149  ORF Transcript_9735/g.17149 Transcript_9735/m.17149 type:complete len:604 (-) Transcript_9735:8-1819(-)
MKALNVIRRTLAGGDVEETTQRAAAPEFKISIVRVKPQPRKHKVISYGYRVVFDGETPEMYKFQYLPDADQPDELHPGVVPAGFSAGVPVDDQMVYFYTREGTTGPEYQVLYSRPDPDGGDMPAYSMVLEWNDDVDALWVDALQRLEDSRELSEDALAFLDADPLWLFGVADPATQRALEKTAVVPMLRCIGQRPCLEEWFAYLNADEKGDEDYKWVVESFAEVELPQPWVSFKGVGSIVCYLNNDTNETTWKHPFYDYFAQLLNHCRRATREEHIKLRINRILWSYEAESQTDVQHQMPLVSPKYVKTLCDILSVDLVEEPYMVRTAKTFLKAFSQMYHEGELDTQEVKWCLEIVENERAKYAVFKQFSAPDGGGEPDPSEGIDSTTHGQLYCVECGLVAQCYCPECGDCLCEKCFEILHARGNRQRHIPNHIIPCVICKTMPAKLQCTYTRGNYCIECYTKKHAKTLPKFLDLKPLKIDYKTNALRPQGKKGQIAQMEDVGPPPGMEVEAKDSFSKPAPLETTLGEKWHAFYDLRGVKYYYNFETQESLRRPQDDLVVYEDTSDRMDHETRQEILGHIAMSKAPRLINAWTESHPAELLPI